LHGRKQRPVQGKTGDADLPAPSRDYRDVRFAAPTRPRPTTSRCPPPQSCGVFCWLL